MFVSCACYTYVLHTNIAIAYLEPVCQPAEHKTCSWLVCFTVTTIGLKISCRDSFLLV